MKCCLRAFALLAAAVAPCSAAAEATSKPSHLVLPAHGTSVDLQTGVVSRKNVSGQCLETVSNAGPFQLVVRRKTGDDVPEVTINGTRQEWVTETAGAARLGSVRLARDGSLVLLRTWKTGKKQIELLQDGQIVRQWDRGSSPKMLRFTEDAAVVLENQRPQSWQLNHYPRRQGGRIAARPSTLVDFGSCQPGRLRISGDVLWAHLDCREGGRKGLYRIDLKTGEFGEPVVQSLTAGFATIARSAVSAKGQPVAIVSGTPAALQFYYATSGLLLSQTGEVRACASDADGSQSWNQSYRLRSLASLFEHTGSEVFAALALKSMRLTLAGQDGRHDRAGPSNPECGWSSTIYGESPGDRLSLMINQAMIANALASSCRKLGAHCPHSLAHQIETANMCLARAFERDFDTSTGIYRISKEVDFRFAGKLAPWNWQIAFAAVLAELPEETYRKRARRIVHLFLKEWQRDENGGLWRYWPREYYLEKGLSPSKVADQRFEDTGHAGITLLTLSDFPAGLATETKDLVGERLDYLLSFGNQTPRDLDGEGPVGHRWFPAGGWSHYPTDAFDRAYGAPVPGRFSADSLYAYAQLFDPSDEFQLVLDIHVCGETCSLEYSRTYSSWSSFLGGNPFFRISDGETVASHDRSRELFDNQSKIHNP